MSQARALAKPRSRFAVAGSKRIDKTTYDAMYAAYVERQSAGHVADRCGVNRETLRGLRAYKARFLKEFDAKSIEDAEVTLATLEKIAKLETLLLGGADRRVAVQAHVRHDYNAVIDAMPDEMLEEFIKTGKSSIEMDRIAEDVWESSKRSR